MNPLRAALDRRFRPGGGSAAFDLGGADAGLAASLAAVRSQFVARQWVCIAALVALLAASVAYVFLHADSTAEKVGAGTAFGASSAAIVRMLLRFQTDMTRTDILIALLAHVDAKEQASLFKGLYEDWFGPKAGG